MDEKQIKVDVWGVCLSRDVFDICPIEGVSVNVYYSTDPCVAMMPKIKQYHLETADFEHLGNWRARNACFEFNREVIDKYANSDSDWLVTDLRLMTYPGYQISENGETIGYTGCWLNSNLSEKDIARYIASKYGKNVEVNPIGREQLHTEDCFEAWCDFIKRRYGDKVILIVPTEAAIGEMDDGRIVVNAMRPARDLNNLLESQWAIKFISKVHCCILNMPDSSIADYSHKWGYNPVHYDSSVYRSVHDAISELMFSHRKDAIGERAFLSLKTAMYSKIVGRDNYLETELQKARKEFEEVRSEDDFEKFRKHYNELLVECEDPSVIAEYERFIGISYRDGRFVSRDAETAKQWLSRAALYSDVACYNLFDILWQDKSDDAWMASIANAMLSHGNGWAMNRIGRMYQYGRFYERNLEEARKWMKKAVEVGELWANNELFDVLWQMGTPEAYSEMIKIAKKQILQGDPNAKCRMARAYQYGKGVEKDTSKALELMKEAVSGNYCLFDELKTMGIDFEVVSGKYWKIIRKKGFTEKNRDVLSISHKGFFIDITNFRLIRNLSNPVLFLPFGLNENELSQFIRYGMFDAIVEYDPEVGFKKHELNKYDDLIEYLNTLVSIVSLKPSLVNKFFTMADLFDQVGAFFKSNGLDVFVIENQPGVLESPIRYELAKDIISEDLYYFQKKTDILCNSNGHSIKYNEAGIYNDSTFDFVHSFNQLNPVDRMLIGGIFNTSQYGGKEVVIINSPSLMRLDYGLQMTDWQHMESVALDQFIDEGSEVIIKLHPYSVSDELFNIRNVKVVDGKTNLDAICYTPTIRIKKLVNMKSSAASKVAAQCDEIVTIGGDFYSQYFYYPIIEYFMFITQESEVGVLQNVIYSESWEKSKLCKNCKNRKVNLQRTVLITNELKDSGCAAVVVVDGSAEDGIEKEYEFRATRKMQIDDGYGIQSHILNIFSKEKGLLSLLTSSAEYGRKYLTIKLLNPS